jgi:chorismate synthase
VRLKGIPVVLVPGAQRHPDVDRPIQFGLTQCVDQGHTRQELADDPRHDPVIVPRAVVVVESMVAVTLVDYLFVGMTSQMNKIKDFYKE